MTVLSVKKPNPFVWRAKHLNVISSSFFIMGLVILRMMLPTYIGIGIEIQQLFQKLTKLLTLHRQILLFPFISPLFLILILNKYFLYNTHEIAIIYFISQPASFLIYLIFVYTFPPIFILTIPSIIMRS